MVSHNYHSHSKWQKMCQNLMEHRPPDWMSCNRSGTSIKKLLEMLLQFFNIILTLISELSKQPGIQFSFYHAYNWEVLTLVIFVWWWRLVGRIIILVKCEWNEFVWDLVLLVQCILLKKLTMFITYYYMHCILYVMNKKCVILYCMFPSIFKWNLGGIIEGNIGSLKLSFNPKLSFIIQNSKYKTKGISFLWAIS